MYRQRLDSHELPRMTHNDNTADGDPSRPNRMPMDKSEQRYSTLVWY